MRTLHFWCDRDNNTLVQGVNAANALSDIVLTQNDALQLIVHNLQRNDAIPALTPYVEKPLEFAAVRFALGYVDAAPRGGSFKLKVGDQTSTQLTWPTNLGTPTLIATWKAAVLTALKALSTVGADGVIAVDPAGTPAHFFYFQWTDAARTTPIEVVELKLIPWIEATIEPGLSSAGYTQLVKLAQFPLAMTSNFARPNPPPVLIIETRPGAAGTNAEQTLVVPSGAMGSVSLQWNGGSTKTMAVATLTAASIAQALNDIVTGGDLTPSFAVEQRAQREGSRFAIAFIGPLAGAAQALIGRTMHDQEALPYATGTLDLKDHLGIEQALNGAPSVKLKLELVIDEGGDETFLRDCTIVNDMTAGGTAASAEAAGAVSVVEKTIYIGSEMGEAFAEAAPGLKFVPPEPGSALVINHGLNTWRPNVRITLHEVDPTIFAADPADLASALTGSRQLDDSEFSEHAVSANTLHIALPWALLDNPASPRDYRLLAIDVASPDTQLLIFPHKHDWDAVLENLPAGQTLRAKLAALDANLAALIGGLKITPDRLDLSSLTTAIISLLTTDTTLRSLFTTLLTTLITDSEIIRKIATELSKYSEFTESVKKLFTDSTLLKTLTEALQNSTDYRTTLRTTILDAIQALTSASVLNDLIPFTVPDLALALPLAEISEQGDDGFFPLPSAQFGALVNDGNITGRLPKAAPALKGHWRTVVTKAHTPGSVREFANGDVVFCTGREWFRGVQDAGKMFTTDFDVTLPFVTVNDKQLVSGARFGFLGGLQIAQTGNCAGRWKLELKVGHLSAEGGGPGNINSPVWDATVLTEELTFDAVGVTHNVGYSVERSSLAIVTTNASATATAVSTSSLAVGMAVLGAGIPVGAKVAGITNLTTFELTAAATASGARTVALLAATKTLYVTTSAAGPPSYCTFLFGIFLSRYDTENVPDPRGIVKLSMKGTRASIAKL